MRSYQDHSSSFFVGFFAPFVALAHQILIVGQYLKLHFELLLSLLVLVQTLYQSKDEIDSILASFLIINSFLNKVEVQLNINLLAPQLKKMIHQRWNKVKCNTIISQKRRMKWENLFQTSWKFLHLTNRKKTRCIIINFQLRKV